MYYFATGGKNFKLFILTSSMHHIVTQLNLGLLPVSLNLRPVPYSTIKAVHRACRDEAFDRFPAHLFREVFQYLLNILSFKHLLELAALGAWQ